MMLKEYLQNHSSDRNFNNADVLDILVACVDEHCDEEKICHVIKKIHEQLFGKHFDEAMLNIVTEHTVQWLNDPDSPYSDGTKIWSYLKH